MKKLIKLCKMCNKVYKTASFHTTLGVDGDVMLEGKTLYIVFRGTELSIRDIFIDCLFYKKVIPYNNIDTKIRIHAGIYYAYQSIRNYIHTLFWDKKVKKVVVTGHSLGGGLAMKCALDIQYNFPKIKVECITFGAMRIGNKYFADSYEKRVPDTLRVINGNCIVSRLPFKFLDYEDAGADMYIQKFPCWFPFVKGCCKDHYPENYLKEIEKCAKVDRCDILLDKNK